MATAILPALLRRQPDLLSLPQKEIDRLVEEERERYHRDIAAERQIPPGDPEEFLRERIPAEEPQGELPVTAGLGVQEADMPEGLGAYTETSPEYQQILQQQPEVSDEQAQRWMEEQEVHDAKYKLQTLIRESRDYREGLIDKHFGGTDPGLRNVQKLGKELAKMEVKTARNRLMEALGKDDPDEMTPQERLVLLNAEDQAKRGAMATVRQQKQDDTATLQQAVGDFNTEQKLRMDLVEKRRAEIQEQHLAMAEAEAAKQEKVPAKVRQAQSLVLKFAKTIDPTVAALIASNPQMANSPLVKKAMERGISPELKPSYNRAIKILNKYYGAREEPEEITGGPTATHEFSPETGLTLIK